MSNIKKNSIVYFGGYSLQCTCKPSLFSSDIYEISCNDCHNVTEIYGIFVWNFSNRFQNFMLGLILLNVLRPLFCALTLG